MRNRNRSYYKTGHLRVWAMDRIPCSDPTYYPVKNSKHAKTLIEALADSQLLDPNITDNAFGLEKLGADGEWEEWADENGNSIDEWEEWTDENGNNIDEHGCVVSENDGNRPIQ